MFPRALSRSAATRPWRGLPRLLALLGLTAAPLALGAQASQAHVEQFLRTPCPATPPVRLQLSAPEATPAATTAKLLAAITTLTQRGGGELVLGPGLWAVTATPQTPYTVLPLPSCVTVTGAGDTLTSIALVRTMPTVRALMGSDQQGNRTAVRGLQLRQLTLTHAPGQAPPWLLQLGAAVRVRLDHVALRTAGPGGMDVSAELTNTIAMQQVRVTLDSLQSRASWPIRPAQPTAMRLAGQGHNLRAVTLTGIGSGSDQIGLEWRGQGIDLDTLRLQQLGTGVRLVGQIGAPEVGRLFARHVIAHDVGTGLAALVRSQTTVTGLRITGGVFDVQQQMLWAYSDTVGAGRLANINLAGVVVSGLSPRSAGVRLEAGTHEDLVFDQVTLARLGGGGWILGGPRTTVVRDVRVTRSGAYDVGCAPGGAVVTINKPVASIDLRDLRLFQRSPCAAPLLGGALVIQGQVQGVDLPPAQRAPSPPGRPRTP